MTHSDPYYNIYSGIPLNMSCVYFDTYIRYIYIYIPLDKNPIILFIIIPNDRIIQQKEEPGAN